MEMPSRLRTFTRLDDSRATRSSPRLRARRCTLQAGKLITCTVKRIDARANCVIVQLESELLVLSKDKIFRFAL